MTFASIPSPSTSVWHLGPLPLRAYALFIVLGIVVAAYIAEKRMRARGAPEYTILDIVVWAVPAGILGARIYHVITSWQLYFGKDGQPSHILYIWEGGLGIWGAVAGGALGAWYACRQRNIPLSFVADALAPALPVAQAIGRLGNWFNNELYGRLTTLPWGLKVHQQMIDGKALTGPDGKALYLPGTYHPTFLYEIIWDLGVALLVFLADRKWKFGGGRAFALYVMAYTAGRAWIEALRIDEANHILGLRINDWVSIIVFVGALVYFIRAKGERIIITPDGPVVEGSEAPATDSTAAADGTEISEMSDKDGADALGTPEADDLDEHETDAPETDTLGESEERVDGDVPGSEATPPRPRTKPSSK